MKQSYADKIREYSRHSYVEPARHSGQQTFEIVTGDVHRGLHLSSQLPNVCQTLKGRQFLEDNGVSIESVDGPPSGQGSRVRIVYRFLDSVSHSSNIPAAGRNPLRRLRGIAKEVFDSLGGAEQFIRGERQTFERPEPRS